MRPGGFKSVRYSVELFLSRYGNRSITEVAGSSPIRQVPSRCGLASVSSFGICQTLTAPAAFATSSARFIRNADIAKRLAAMDS